MYLFCISCKEIVATIKVPTLVLRWILRKWDVGAWTGSSWLRIGTGGGASCILSFVYIL